MDMFEDFIIEFDDCVNELIKAVLSDETENMNKYTCNCKKSCNEAKNGQNGEDIKEEEYNTNESESVQALNLKLTHANRLIKHLYNEKRDLEEELNRLKKDKVNLQIQLKRVMNFISKINAETKEFEKSIDKII